MKVLLVDDDENVRALLELTLTMRDPSIDLRAVGNGDRGLEICQEWRPDALVVDGHMPGLSGNDLGEALRAAVPDATIVSFTGVASEVSWADLQVVKASDNAAEKVVDTIVASSS